jgi:hypothetical protein
LSSAARRACVIPSETFFPPALADNVWAGASGPADHQEGGGKGKKLCERRQWRAVSGGWLRDGKSARRGEERKNRGMGGGPCPRLVAWWSAAPLPRPLPFRQGVSVVVFVLFLC